VSLAADPYVLPLPSPVSRVITPPYVVAVHAHLNARYADPVWPLAPLTEHPSAPRYSIYWKNCPATMQDELRLVTWTMLNGQLRPTFMKERADRARTATMRSRLGVDGMTGTVSTWMSLARWLAARQLTTLAACDPAVFHEFSQHLAGKNNARSYLAKQLTDLTRLWAFDQLSAQPAGVARPPWDQAGTEEFLPARTSSGGENEREPVAAGTMGPLLIWAMRMVEDCAGDILTAWAERQRLHTIAHASRATPAAAAALASYLHPMLTGQAPVPVITGHGPRTLARAYIGGLTGAAKSQIDRAATTGLLAAAAQRPGPCPLNLPVTGRIAGNPWRERLDYDEIPALMRHLGTAAFIVCAYLTGMRPGEILGLRSGCCPDPEPGEHGGEGRCLIRGHVFKAATDEDGNHISAGTERDVPWVAITPVVNAIRVLEHMVPPGSLLFDRNVHDLRSQRSGTGSLKLTSLRTRIEDFTGWANAEAARHALRSEIIPPDPHGLITPSRFRRTLAWHIARRPGGLVALAIQYGHLRTTLPSQGYAARGRHGIHDLINIETACVVADTIAGLHDQLDNGGGVSGPAARRAITTAAQAPRFTGTLINATTARRLLANQDVTIYDNPQAFLLCHYKRSRALCHRDGAKDTPSLDHCVPGCANIVRTDQHATLLRDRADVLDKHASLAPQPIADRLSASAAKLRDLAATHARTRITSRDTR
jgi:integrase